MPPDSLRVLIVDDEPLARQRLTDLLEARPDVDTIETASHGAAAIDILESDPPDLVFLDVQMPGETGLDVVREVGPENMPVTIFVTAYDEFALRAFDLAALDYLLKPFDDERFEKAFERALETIRLRTVDALKDRFLALLQDEPVEENTQSKDTSSSLKRIAVESRGQAQIVSVEDITHITADGPYLKLHTDEDTHLLRERMKTLDEQLDPTEFFRIHRSTIVRLDCIEALIHQSGGRYVVRLHDDTRLPVSRRRREELEDRLGLHL